MVLPTNTETNIDVYLHPIEVKLRERYLQLVDKHGVGIYAVDELNWEVYDKHFHLYNNLSEEEKFILNSYMSAFTKLYR